MGDRDDDASRRRVLAVAGLSAGTALAGCLGGSGGEPTYESGEAEVDGEARSAEEMTAAEAVAVQEVRDGVTPLESLSIEDHEFVLEDGYQGATVQGTVENASGDRIELVEVRARVYDDQGNRLGRYLDRTGDLDAGDRWAFTIVVLEAPNDVAEYDVAVLGTPA